MPALNTEITMHQTLSVSYHRYSLYCHHWQTLLPLIVYADLH